MISTLGRPMNEDRVAHMEILTVERLNFKRRTVHVPNLMHKLLQFIFTAKHCRPLYIVKMNRVWLILSSTSESGIKFDTWKGRRLNWSLGPKRRTIIFWTGVGGGGSFHMQTLFLYAAPAANNFLVCLRLPAKTLFYTYTQFFFSIFSLSNLFFSINFPSLLRQSKNNGTSLRTIKHTTGDLSTYLSLFTFCRTNMTKITSKAILCSTRSM